MSSANWSELDRAELERRYREACDLLLASEEEVARLASAFEVASREIEAALAELAIAREDVAVRTAELHESARLRAVRDEQLAGVLGSASWRVTRPLRVLKALMRETDA